MKLNVDSAEATENTGEFQLLPEQVFEAQITEISDKQTQNGDPMVSVKIEIMEPPFKGRWIYDNIVIPRSPESPAFGIMGRTMHFLHVIGQPYKGKFAVDSDKWLYAKLKIKIKHQVPEKGKYAGQKIASVQTYDFINDAQDDSDIPF